MKLAAIIRADTDTKSIREARKVQGMLLDHFGVSLHSVRMAEPRLFGVACLKALNEKPDALVVVGGTATARNAGEIAYRHKIPIAFLPGERPNLVARRVWGARSIGTIIDTLARGDFELARMDAGSAAGRVFLISAACGVIPQLARLREELHDAHSFDASGKALWRIARLLARRPRVQLQRVGLPNLRTAGLLAGVAMSERMALHTQRARQFPTLQCWMLPPQRFAALASTMIKTLSGTHWLAEPAEYFEAGELGVEAGRSTWIVLDDVPMRLASPARLQILPGAIRTLIPRAERQRAVNDGNTRRVMEPALRQRR